MVRNIDASPLHRRYTVLRDRLPGPSTQSGGFYVNMLKTYLLSQTSQQSRGHRTAAGITGTSQQNVHNILRLSQQASFHTDSGFPCANFPGAPNHLHLSQESTGKKKMDCQGDQQHSADNLGPDQSPVIPAQEQAHQGHPADDQERTASSSS